VDLGPFKLNKLDIKMKKYIVPFLIVAISFLGGTKKSIAQKTLSPKEVMSVFPYQVNTQVANALESMGTWKTNDWNTFFSLVLDSTTQTKFTYALHAYVNKVSLEEKNKKAFVALLTKQLNKTKLEYAKILYADELKLLNDNQFVNTRLQQLPLQSTKTKSEKTFTNPTQQLLNLQDKLEQSKIVIERKTIIWEASKISSIGSFMFIAKFLQDPALSGYAATALARLSLNNESIRGDEVRSILEQSLPLIHGEDSVYIVPVLTAHIKKMPYDYGYVSLFNGKDLTGWKGLVANPIARANMNDTALKAAQIKADIKMNEDWVVKDGLLNFTGNLHGENLATVKQYGDIEMFVDWRIQEKGDAGIYLRGTPQVQIWDTSRREVGAQVGSGGLYNNQKNVSKPLVVADNKVGEWNNFHIIMRGDKVTVYLNGVLVTDNIPLENYWNHNLPLFAKEQIELQAHGTFVSYRNIYLRELPSNEAVSLNEAEKNEGFSLLFDGTNIDEWTGNTVGYLIQDGALVVNPENGSGGNLYTKNEYSDFIYRFDFQLTPGANNGIGIHAPLTGDAAYVGMEVQVLDSEDPKYAELKPYQYHGSVYGVIPAKRGYLKPTGEWNNEEIMVKGTMIKVTLNGTLILEGDYAAASKNGTIDHLEHPGLLNKTGHIGFLGHGDIVRFKNMRIMRI
jgi:Domain of Unknown Function (DUF1080)